MTRPSSKFPGLPRRCGCDSTLTQARLDKNIFKQGFTELQDKLDERFYTTTLHFAHDLCQAINVGINTERPLEDAEPRAEPLDASQVKQNNYSEARDRRRLGKRILKSLEPYLEAALKAEADICGKPPDSFKKELEGMMEASLEVRQPASTSITVSQDDSTAPRPDQDVEMADAPAEGQIIVADQSEDEADADADGEADPDHDEAMDGIEPSQGHGGGEDNIEVSAPDEEHEDVGTSKPNGANVASAQSPPDEQQQQCPETMPGREYDHQHPLTNGFTKDANSTSPPSLPGSFPQQQHHHNHLHSNRDPLTPPQSNGSFAGQPHQQPSSSCCNAGTVLSAGGIPWYLGAFELQGTSAVEEQWTGREAVRRALSEELTDMDDDALKDLEFDVDEDNTITASPPVTDAGAGAEETTTAAADTGTSATSTTTGGGGGNLGNKGGTPRKTLRSASGKATPAVAGVGVAAVRRAVRSSARRR